jgi:hypothetical protein
MAYYTAYKNRGFLSSRLQLERLKARLQRGEQNASFLLPFTAGPEPEHSRALMDIDWSVARKGVQQQQQQQQQQPLQ